MTAGRSPRSGAVAWLTAQAVAFGAWAALLGVVANAMFLEAYGSEWLPVTYIVIGIAGVVVSAAIRRGAARFDLLRLAIAVLGGASALFFASWLIATGPEGAWVSGPLLVLFPILIQLGFVFIGGQAGRVLDIAGIKASFPRIMAGFPIGAVLGGVAAVPLVGWFGRVEDLLLVTAAAEVAFAALVWATGRRYARLLEAPSLPASSTALEREHDRGELSLRGLVGRPLFVLVLAYQVLSALGSQLADFLVFDRASALFPAAEDLGRFAAVFTAVMNGVAIAFLFLFAGPLLRRFGLRLGTAAQPLAGLSFSIAILVVLVGLGPASVALLAIVSAARIADVALTDGMTRTSINTVYQVLPTQVRLVAQATVEGMGVPIAIGVSGVLILLLNAMPDPLGARIVVLALVCAAWTWAARRLYRAYGPALVDVLRSERLLDADATLEATPADLVTLRGLLADTDPTVAQLGRELVAALPSTGLAADLTSPTARAFAVPGRLDAAGIPGRVARGEEGLDALDAVLQRAAASPADWGEAATAARLVRAMRTPSPARDAVLLRHVAHPDRWLGHAVVERLAAATPAPASAAPVLEAVRRSDIEHVGRILEATGTLAGEPELDPGETVQGALGDELALLRRRIVAALVAQHGRDKVAVALGRLGRGEGETAIAAEALEVALGHAEAVVVATLLDPAIAPSEQHDRLESPDPGRARQRPRGARAVLVDLAEDRDATWRSPWLRACAIRALRLSGIAPVGLAPAPAATDSLVAEELALVGGDPISHPARIP